MRDLHFDLSYLGKDTVRRARHGMPWTATELANLKFLYGDGRSLEYICECMKRQAAGVVPKLESMGLIDRYEIRKQIPTYSLYDKEPVSPEPPLVAWASKDGITEGHQLDAFRYAFLATTEKTMTATIETKTFISGVDAASMTDEAIFKKIAEIESSIAKWKAIETKPKKLTALIAKMTAEVQALVDYVDAR